MLEGCSAQHAFCCIRTHHQHAMNRIMPQSAASSDAVVADKVVQVLTLWSMDPSEKNQRHRRLHQRSQRARAELHEKSISLNSAEESSTSNGPRKVISLASLWHCFSSTVLPGHRPSRQILHHHPRRAERTNGTLPSCCSRSCFEPLAIRYYRHEPKQMQKTRR